MSRMHYENCLADGWQECNCYEFDKALEWVKPYLQKEIAELVLEGKENFIRNNDPRHPLYNLGEHQTALNIFDGILALLEKELK